MADRPKEIVLKRGLARRAERGHLWVFSNEVETVTGDPAPGDEVKVFSAKRRFLGMGLFSKSSMIRARIYSRQWQQPCDAAFIASRVRQALAYREALNGGARPHSFRLIHSESDGLPGLVADVFGDHVVIQISTFAMEQRRDAILTALIETLAPRAIIERSDVPYRRVEGMEERKGCVYGEARTPCEIVENGVTLLADLLEGQKTGYYLDQVRNRALAIPFFKGKRVLDLFCYVGAWAIVAAAHGAREVLGVDSSERALELARRALEANGLLPPGPSDQSDPSDRSERLEGSERSEKAEGARCAFLKADVFELLRAMVERGERFDVIVLDPPALAKSKKDAPAAVKAYRELNLRAMKLLTDDGLLITCSCSYNVSLEDFHGVLTMAAKDTHCDFSIVQQTTQAPDHPIHLQTPETSYLKAFFLKKRSL